MTRLRVLDLFAGIGGVTYGLERAGGFEPVGFCEINPSSQKSLRSNWPNVKIISDVKEIKGDEFGEVDVLTAGYPCQPFSVAGGRGGETDSRHLWPEVHRIIRAVRPRYVLLENVTGHLSLGFGNVLRDLASCGFDAEWDCIPASTFGAPHKRDRLFVLAYPNGARFPRPVLKRSGLCKPEGKASTEFGDTIIHTGLWWRENSGDIYMGDGVPTKLARSRVMALGNAVVPQVIEFFGKAILTAEGHNDSTLR